MPRFIRVPQGFMPGEYSTFHTCEALCQEEATFHTCAKALRQEKEPRILCVPRLYARRKKKSHVSYVCQGFMPGRRIWATYLTCAKAYASDTIEEEEEKKKKKSHISYVCEGYMPGRGRRRRRFTKSCLRPSSWWRILRESRKSCQKHSCCHAYVCCVLETMEKRVLDTHMPRCPTLWANKRKKYSVDTHCSLFTVQDMMLF